MTCPCCSLAGNSLEKTQLLFLTLAQTHEKSGIWCLQIGRAGVKVQLQCLSPNGDGFQVRLIILFWRSSDRSIVRGSGGGSSRLDFVRDSETDLRVFAEGLGVGDGTSKLLPWCLGVGLGDGELLVP